VTVRAEELISFHETVKKISANPKELPYRVPTCLVALLETRVEYDADMIENMTQKITQLSNSLTLQEADEELLSEIKNLQEKDDDAAREHHRQATSGIKYVAQRVYGRGVAAQAHYDYQGHQLARGTHQVQLRPSGLPTRHLPRLREHRAEQDHQDFYHRIGHLHAAHAYREHLRDELRDYAGTG
jgi:hypothetical protein